MTSGNVTPRLGAVLALAMAAVAGSCKDSTGPGGHADPAGLRAVLEGAVVVSVNAAREVTGSFTVATGQTTPRITVQFVDADGNAVSPGSNFYLGYQVDSPATVTVLQDTPGEFAFRLRGGAAGTTTIRLQLMHGRHPGGHPDYVSPNLPVVVGAAAAGM